MAEQRPTSAAEETRVEDIEQDKQAISTDNGKEESGEQHPQAGECADCRQLDPGLSCTAI